MLVIFHMAFHWSLPFGSKLPARLLRYKVASLQGCFATRLLRYKVASLQGCFATRLLRYKVASLQGCFATRLLRYKVASLQGCFATRLLRYKIASLLILLQKAKVNIDKYKKNIEFTLYIIRFAF